MTGGNIFLGARADVAETCRLGSGLLRRMLRAPSGRKYGVVTGKGDVWLAVDELPDRVDDGAGW